MLMRTCMAKGCLPRCARATNERFVKCQYARQPAGAQGVRLLGKHARKTSLPQRDMACGFVTSIVYCRSPPLSQRCGQYNEITPTRGLPVQEPAMFGVRKSTQQEVALEVQDEFIERVQNAAEDFRTAVPTPAALDYSMPSVAALDAVLQEAHSGRLALTPMQTVGAAA